MRSEYLFFNLFVLSGPIFLSFLRPTYFLHRWKVAWLAVFLVAPPYLVWDALVSGRHWFFNDAYTLPLRLFGLPPGEILFFFSVPFACLFSWETLFKPTPRPPLAMRLRPLRLAIMWGLIPLGILLLVWGKEYTGLTCFALASAAWADWAWKSDLLLMPRFYAFLLFVTALIFVFNGYLTARPVVLYGRAYQMDLRLWTIPIEDFFYGHSLVIWVTVLLERFKAQRPPSAIYASTHRIA